MALSTVGLALQEGCVPPSQFERLCFISFSQAFNWQRVGQQQQEDDSNTEISRTKWPCESKRQTLHRFVD